MISHQDIPSVDTDLKRLVAQLQTENQQLRQVNTDLKIALSTITEHGDLIEAELHDANRRLESEMAVRIRAEATLKTLVDMISRQKTDLEIIVHTLMEHGDVLDNQWYQKFNLASQEAGIDGLTQIPNRRRFDEYLNQQWHQLAQARSPLAVILCDIDSFKAYNDTYGHLAGDACLCQVANALEQCLQSPKDLVARYGGEEFVVLLPQTDLPGATSVARRIQRVIRALQIPHLSSSAEPVVTVSIGVASLIPDPSEGIMQVIRLADDRLYQAKRLGKDRIVTASPSA